MLVSCLYSSGIALVNGVNFDVWTASSGNSLSAYARVCKQECIFAYLLEYSSHNAKPCLINHRAFATVSFAHTVQGWLRKAPLSVAYGVPSFLGNVPYPRPHFSDATIESIWHVSNGILTTCLSGKHWAHATGSGLVTKMFTF